MTNTSIYTYNPTYFTSKKELAKFKKEELIDFMVEEYRKVTEVRSQLREQLAELEAKQPEDMLIDLKEEIEELRGQLEDALLEEDNAKDDLRRTESKLEEAESKIEDLEMALEDRLNSEEIEEILDSLTSTWKHRFDTSHLATLAVCVPAIKNILT